MFLIQQSWPLVAATRSRLGRDPYFSVYLVQVEALVKNSLAQFVLAAGSGVDWISMFRVSNKVRDLRITGLIHLSIMNTKAQCVGLSSSLGIKIHVHI